MVFGGHIGFPERDTNPGGEGVLQCITYTDFEAPDLERGNHFRGVFQYGVQKIVDHGFIFCLKLLLIMKKHLFDV